MDVVLLGRFGGLFGGSASKLLSDESVPNGRSGVRNALWGGTILSVFGYDDVMMRSFFMFSFDFFVTMFSCDDALNLPLIGP